MFALMKAVASDGVTVPDIMRDIDRGLPTLIRIKEAAVRPKDREAVAELRVLLEETERRQS